MRLSDKMADAINDQIGNEFSSAWQYLALVAWFEDRNLEGFAHWMRMQFAEEQAHGQKFLEFLIDHGAPVRLRAITAPRHEFEKISDVFAEVVRYEETVTRQVFDLYELSMAEKAYSAKVMLEWFINEQVEEEKTARSVLERVELVQDNPAALLVLDQQLGARTAAPAAAESA